MIFNSHMIEANQKRAKAMAQGSFLRPALRESLLERLSWINRVFDKACEINAPNHQLIKDLIAAQKVNSGESLAPDSQPHHNTYDALFALHGLETINDLPQYLRRLTQSLAPDGLMLVAMLGGDSLTELRQACLQADLAIDNAARLRVHPCLHWQDAGKLLQHSGLALPVVDRETYPVAYTSLMHLARDLRAMGLGNCLTERSKQPLSHQHVNLIETWLREHYPNDNGGFIITFDVIWLMGWSPHPDQPQAKPRGSAHISLKDALAESQKKGESINKESIQAHEPTKDQSKPRDNH